MTTTLPAKRLRTPQGTDCMLLRPVHRRGPRPLLLLLAADAQSTLETAPYCLVGRHLHKRGWNVASMDLPCHGAESRAGEPAQLNGWAARVAAGEDIVAVFQVRVNKVLAALVQAGLADPQRLATAGTSRGGFMAFQAAAGNPRIRAAAGFSPVTSLAVLHEFAGLQNDPLTRRLGLSNAVDALADRAVWLTIGNDDTRVGTDQATAWAGSLADAGRKQHLDGNVTLHVVNTPGHTSLPQWHAAAADWFASVPCLKQ